MLERFEVDAAEFRDLSFEFFNVVLRIVPDDGVWLFRVARQLCGEIDLVIVLNAGGNRVAAVAQIAHRQFVRVGVVLLLLPRIADVPKLALHRIPLRTKRIAAGNPLADARLSYVFFRVRHRRRGRRPQDRQLVLRLSTARAAFRIRDVQRIDFALPQLPRQLVAACL